MRVLFFCPSSGILDPDIQSQFKDLLHMFSDVFSPDFTGYSGAIGLFEASVNMGPAQPPQRKGIQKTNWLNSKTNLIS